MSSLALPHPEMCENFRIPMAFLCSFSFVSFRIVGRQNILLLNYKTCWQKIQVPLDQCGVCDCMWLSRDRGSLIGKGGRESKKNGLAATAQFSRCPKYLHSSLSSALSEVEVATLAVEHSIECTLV